jgi:hypothetical protein
LDLLLQADETIAAALDEEGEFSELNEETILAIPVVTWTSPKYPHLRPGIYVCFHLSCCLVLIMSCSDKRISPRKHKNKDEVISKMGKKLEHGVK